MCCATVHLFVTFVILWHLWQACICEKCLNFHQESFDVLGHCAKCTHGSIHSKISTNRCQYFTFFRNYDMNLHSIHNVLFGHLSNIQALEFNLYEDSWQKIIIEESADCGAFYADSRLGDAFLERRNTSYTCYTWQTFLPRDQLSPGAALVYGHRPEWFWGNHHHDHLYHDDHHHNCQSWSRWRRPWWTLVSPQEFQGWNRFLKCLPIQSLPATIVWPIFTISLLLFLQCADMVAMHCNAFCPIV